MYGSMKKNMGFSLMIIAFFFLFEPSYALLDPIPDFVGYFILCAALINIADINSRVMEAFYAFRKAAFLSISEYISLYVLHRFFDDTGKAVGRLVFVFVFAFLEIIILLPAYKALFTGLLNMGMFDNSKAIYQQKKPRGANATEKMYTLSIVFILFKNILCMLPEFTSLETNSNYEFISLLRFFAFILVMPISVVWLINFVKYLKSIINDTAFIQSISSKYLEYTSSATGFYTHRVLSVGLMGYAIAFVVCIDLYSDNINLLPDLVFYSIALLSVLFLKKYSTKWKIASISFVLGALISITSQILEKRFFEQYTIGAIKREIEAYSLYYASLVAYIIQATVLVISVALILLFICDIYKEHSRMSKQNDEREKRKEKSGFIIRALIALALCVLSAVSSVYYCWALHFYSLGWIYYYSGFINTVVTLSFIASALELVIFVKNAVTSNYKMYL